ncbi:MAG: hypothetical protein HFE54_01940 [Turicibacter sp.]|nr:hypothetical protein [Turicibacter sp.]
MKRVCLIAGLAVTLAGCANNNETAKSISTPQTLQNLSVAPNTTAPATSDQTSASTEQTTNDSSNASDTQTESGTEKTFSTQQEFVDCMYEKVKALEDTISLLDSNLTQVYSVTGTDEEAAQLSIRKNLIKQTTSEMEAIEKLLTPTEEVDKLHDYVVKAYEYNIDYKSEEYEVFKAESLEDRQVLLDANAEKEHLAKQYITLAWAEIDRLSETTYDRK